MGDGTTTNRVEPTRVGTATDWTLVTTGQDHSCGMRSGGALYCWGRNHRGQLGLGDTLGRPTPTVLGQTWAKVSAGTFHTCGINTGQRLLCWGLNGSGQTGTDNAGTSILLPTIVSSEAFFDATLLWSDVAAGGQHSCGVLTQAYPFSGALANATNLACWGHNGYGQLGLTHFTGAVVDSPGPVGRFDEADVYTDWTKVSLGYNHSCGIRADGTLWCFGRNLAGQLGTNSVTDFDFHPVQVGTQGGWVDISGGYNHTVATRFDN